MKHLSERKYRCLLAAGILGLTGCVDESNQLGKNLVDSVFRNVFTDTCTVTASVLRFDSIETSGKRIAWVGRYTHPLWGTHTASSFVAYTRPAYNTAIEKTVVFDSLMLHLDYRASFAGDTTFDQKIDVHRLTQKPVLNDNSYLYTHSAFHYEPDALGSLTFRPKPTSGSPVEIRLSDAFGQELLTRFHTRDDRVSDEYFSEYFKGLVLLPDTQVCRSLLAFGVADTTTTLVLHYHVKNELSDGLTLKFSPTISTQFNRVEHDYSGTPLDRYSGKRTEIPSDTLGKRGLLYGMAGWYTRLDFPYLNNLLHEGEAVEIEDAWLRIYPETGTYTPYNPLPDSLYLYIADDNNVITDVVQNTLGSEVQIAYLVYDTTYGGNTYYAFDITSFLQQELGAFGQNKHNLQLVFTAAGFTEGVGNLTFGDRNSRYPLRLHVTYKIYENK